jgi:YD repeat-containing protein
VRPIDFATGNTYIVQSDLSVPGLGGGLSLTRTWNSMLPSIQNTMSGMFGMNWRSTYEERLIFQSADKYLKYARSDGSVWSYGMKSDDSSVVYQTAAPASDVSTITTTTTDPNYTLVAKSGEKKVFDGTTGQLVSVTDRNGNTTQLIYDANQRLTTVTDPAGRHLYFAYTSPTSSLVSNITSDVGIALSYTYDGLGRLTKVTNPDATTLSFEFDSLSKITAVKDSDGKVLESHSYDALGRGLSGSRADGVDSVTVAYPQ